MRIQSQSPDPTLRAVGAWGLVELGEPDALELARTALATTDPQVRLAAFEWLQQATGRRKQSPSHNVTARLLTVPISALGHSGALPQGGMRRALGSHPADRPPRTVRKKARVLGTALAPVRVCERADFSRERASLASPCLESPRTFPGQLAPSHPR